MYFLGSVSVSFLFLHIFQSRNTSVNPVEIGKELSETALRWIRKSYVSEIDLFYTLFQIVSDSTDSVIENLEGLGMGRINPVETDEVEWRDKLQNHILDEVCFVRFCIQSMWGRDFQLNMKMRIGMFTFQDV